MIRFFLFMIGIIGLGFLIAGFWLEPNQRIETKEIGGVCCAIGVIGLYFTEQYRKESPDKSELNRNGNAESNVLE
ncbi:hypothetical protein [Arcanobacterium hippocoleae]|uniref:hypothetical protein n=1 Tax=Arcanobacterium hippocoleae TaxID=149017 RepID=UPI0033403BD6